MTSPSGEHGQARMSRLVRQSAVDGTAARRLRWPADQVSTTPPQCGGAVAQDVALPVRGPALDLRIASASSWQSTNRPAEESFRGPADVPTLLPGEPSAAIETVGAPLGVRGAARCMRTRLRPFRRVTTNGPQASA